MVDGAPDAASLLGRVLGMDRGQLRRLCGGAGVGVAKVRLRALALRRGGSRAVVGGARPEPRSGGPTCRGGGPPFHAAPPGGEGRGPGPRAVAPLPVTALPPAP